MIIICPACETRYYAGETVVGNRARKVRCAKCAHEWMLEPEIPAEAEAEAEVAPPARREPSAARAPVARIVDPAAEEEPRLTATDAAGGDIYLPRRARGGLDRLASIALAVMLLVLAAAAAYQYRTQIVRFVPPLGGLYAKIGLPVNARGLEIRKPEWRIETRNGRPVLVVTGEIANVAKHPVAVPRLSLLLRDDKGHELYRWSAAIDDVKSVKPGATAPFTTTLESPPAEAHDIEIRFAGG
jgi:predicted Zn finger-like uncharacterized protein